MTMAKSYPTMFQAARKEAHLTQEQAAELLAVSVETVKAWEQGQRFPRPEDAGRMMETYQAEWLGLAYIQATCGCLKVLPDEITLQGLPTAVLVLINRATDLADDYRRLMEISEDGQIDATERPEFNRITKNIEGVIAAGFQVLYATPDPGKKERPEAATSGRPVRGLASGNNSKLIISRPRKNASLRCSQGGGASL